jgi:hypothetical protein
MTATIVALVRIDCMCHTYRNRVVPNPYVQVEAFLPLIMRGGNGKLRRSGVADAFDISCPAGHFAGFMAQQFHGLAIEVHDKSFIGQLAGGGANSSFFK